MTQYNNVEYGNLIEGIKTKNQELTKKNEDLKELGEDAARFKRNYAVALAKKILELKSEGKPATLIKELAQGDDEIAELRFQKDTGKVVFDACKSSVLNLRLQVESYRSLLSCEKSERFNKDV